MLDDEDRVAGFSQIEQRLGQVLDVRKMQTCRRFIEHIERASRRPPAQLKSQLHALRFSTRKGRSWLTQGHVAEPHLIESAQFFEDARNGLEDLQPIFNRHVQDIGD